MFEIGSSLREARVRQGLDLSEIERDTHIRKSYLAALEDDRFDALPAPAYAKGFLRTYADYLGLDAQRFVDEYNTRFAPEEEPPAPPPVRIRRPRIPRERWMLTAIPVGALVIGLIAWQLSAGGGRHQPPVPPRTTTSQARTSRPAATTTAAQPPAVARIVLVAGRGPCWLSVHIGSPTGKLIYASTLPQGRTARFVSRRLWIRFGAPWNVDATLNGKAVRLPTSTGDVTVTPTGFG
jgi:transcriptional regulator with XRE-family HTH domain